MCSRPLRRRAVLRAPQAGADRAQQAELLQSCLECWQGGNGGGQPGKDGEADARTFAKLAEFVATQRTFTWSQIIDIVQLAGGARERRMGLCLSRWPGL